MISQSIGRVKNDTFPDLADEREILLCRRFFEALKTPIVLKKNQ